MYIIENTTAQLYFSFCIYGAKLIYHKGLLENLNVIANIQPQPQVIIGYESGIIEEYKNKYESYPFVKLINIDALPKMLRMSSRILNIDIIPRNSYVFCRDADSRIGARDIWCIQEFINSKRKLHIIRDHYYHKQKLMGGMWGLYTDDNTINFGNIYTAFYNSNQNLAEYGFDEAFLSSQIYPLFRPEDIKIHSNVIGLLGETVSLINIEQESDTDFIGNVYDENNKPQFSYSKYITYDYLKWLEGQKQWNLITYNKRYINIESEPWANRQKLYLCFLNAALASNNLDECLALSDNWDRMLIDDHLINHTNRILELAKTHNYKIIATTDIDREPESDEIIIYYGQYPNVIECIPNVRRKIYRHPIYFSNVAHTKVEYNPCWEPISKIYILNLEERIDRYLNILVELCRVKAPLDRIYHYKAQKTNYTGNRQQDAYIGATNNHLDVTRDFIKSGNDSCLILEDDITFISDINTIFKSLSEFYSKERAYDMCFLSYSKHGEIKYYDDLLSLSYQPCTTSSAYLLNKESAHLIEDCLRIGVEEMRNGKSPNVYCCDRYWIILQKRHKMFVFKRKLAFQQVTYSDIVNKINYAFD